jgi:hypothetical protein
MANNFQIGSNNVRPEDLWFRGSTIVRVDRA